jgi:hypothetical protein
MRAVEAFVWVLVSALALEACGETPTNNPGDGGNLDARPTGDGGFEPPDMPTTFTVELVPNNVTGTQRVNFAIPLAAGVLSAENEVRILVGGSEVPAARRGLARRPDGSLRSVQVQFEVDVSSPVEVTVELGVAGMGGVDLVSVQDLLTGTGVETRPRVWALLPAGVLAASGFAGPIVPTAELAGSPLRAWAEHCDYARWDTDAFLPTSGSSRDVWLFDRVTAMYRGYAASGLQVPLESAYREAALYLGGMTISGAGVATGIAVPGASSDLKYHYSQGMALHYLLTGDDRYREAAEAISAKVATMWDPEYDGADGFWTERHAGFALLAHEWAALVTDDKATAIEARATTAVDAFIAAQMAPRFGQTSTTARCFAHTATAHGEDYGTDGCSPWMSAIVADALDAHARRVGGTRAIEVRASLARLARAIAEGGLASNGRPYYWMGVGGDASVTDDYDEHWGESAYVVALGWDADGRADASLEQVADGLVDGFAEHGEVGQVRSFNWQCRSAVMAPALLR